MSRLMCAFIDISRFPWPLTERSRPESSASRHAGGTLARSPRAQLSKAHEVHPREHLVLVVEVLRLGVEVVLQHGAPDRLGHADVGDPEGGVVVAGRVAAVEAPVHLRVSVPSMQALLPSTQSRSRLGPVGRGEPREQRVPVEERRLLLAARGRGRRKRDRDGARRPRQDRQDSCATSHRGSDCAIAAPGGAKDHLGDPLRVVPGGHVTAVAQDLGAHAGRDRARAGGPSGRGPPTPA